MKSIVIHAARDLRIEEQEVSPPGPGEVQIKMAAGGICGSDLHYYQHGGFGTIRLREPMGSQIWRSGSWSPSHHRGPAGIAAIVWRGCRTIA